MKAELPRDTLRRRNNNNIVDWGLGMAGIKLYCKITSVMVFTRRGSCHAKDG